MKLRHVVAVAVSALAIEAGVQTLGFAQDGWAQEIRVGRSEDELRVEDAANREMAQARRDAQRAVEAAHKATEATKVKWRTFFPRPDGLPRHLTAIQDAAERYRDASDGAAKDKAKAELLALIDKYFEEDMLNRKQELAAIEARLAKLRAQLDRRREKKDDIVNLQYQVAVNEAEGLGFTSPPKDNPFNIRVEAPVLVSPVSDDVFRAMPAPPLGPPTPLPPPTLTSERPTLEEGATGELVEMLQRTLNSRVKPSLDIAIDSDFGPETRSAVEKFQSQNGLPPTGVVDAATWKALGPLEKSDGRFQVKSTP